LSNYLRRVSPRYRTPVHAIWAVAGLSVLFTVYTPVYSTITAVCVIFLYVSYVLPAALGFWARGKTWTVVGPWSVGRLYKPLAAVSVMGCALLIVIGVQPPNEKALPIVAGAVRLSLGVWFGLERRRFQGPPQGVMIQARQRGIAAEERALSAGSRASETGP